MVTASPGAFVTCDVPTKQYLVWLNTQNKLSGGKVFILREIDDTHLLVREDHLDFVIQQVKEFTNKNVYTPPVEQQ